MTVINIHEAKTHFAQLLQRALEGEDIVIAKHGKPLVRLVPVNALGLQPRVFGRHAKTLSNEARQAALSPMTEEELGSWDS